MYDLIVADVERHMSGVTYNIAGLCICKASYIISYRAVCGRRMRERNSEILVYAHDKSGAIRTVCQAGSAVHIRVTYKLQCIISNCLSYIDTS